MRRLFVLSALVGLLTMTLAGPAFAGMIACPPQPAPGSTLECGVSHAEPEATIPWQATFADGTEVDGEVTTNEDGAGGLAVDIPDDPELEGTQFTIALEDGGSYTGSVGAAGDAEAAATEEEADGGAGEAKADDGNDGEGFVDTEDEQVTERPDEDSEIALGAGGTAGPATLSLVVASLGILLVLGGSGFAVRVAVRR